MVNEEKITLENLLRHVVGKKSSYMTLHFFDFGEGIYGDAAWCKFVVDDMTKEVRDIIDKMQNVTYYVLGKKLDVNVYTKYGHINFTNETDDKIEEELDLSGTLGMFEMELASKRIIRLINQNTIYKDVPLSYEDFLDKDDSGMMNGLLHLIYRGYVIPSYPNSVFTPSDKFYEKFSEFIDKDKRKVVSACNG